MEDDEMRILRLCNPEVVLQGPPNKRFEHQPPIEPPAHYMAACRLEDKGMLEFVRDQDFNQLVYRITPKGLAERDKSEA